MPPRKSTHGHGRSEIHLRPEVVAAVTRERHRVGERVRELRTRRGLTQDAAAELIGIHPVHLRRLERGVASVTLTTLVAIAMAFRVPLRSLVSQARTP